jgi:hypothetical protein
MVVDLRNVCTFCVFFLDCETITWRLREYFHFQFIGDRDKNVKYGTEIDRKHTYTSCVK